MYSSELYSQSDISSILPPYEIEPQGILVAGEEIVCNSTAQNASELNATTKDYILIGEDGGQEDRSGLVSTRMDLKVSVVRKVNPGTASPWFPKKVVIMTDIRRIESLAWAHSSNDLASSSNVSEISCSLESESGTDLPMDSDPSLSSINASSWYPKQTTVPSATSSNSNPDFQMSSISVEQDMEAGPLVDYCPSMDSASCDGTGKELNTESKFGLELRQYSVPLKVFPKHTRHRSSPSSGGAGEHDVYPCFVEGCCSILKSRTALRKHAKVHAERNFSCDRCGKRFAERTKLSRHVQCHAGERAFKCKVDGCTKAFSLKSNLKSHLKTHTGERPHRCQICQHAFLHPYNLRVHLSRRHKDKE